MEREKLKSRLGFILLSAGCAIGIGNVWKFPYICLLYTSGDAFGGHSGCVNGRSRGSFGLGGRAATAAGLFLVVHKISPLPIGGMCLTA